MEIGMALPHYGKNASTQAIGYVAQAADEMGLGSLWVFERLLRVTVPVQMGWGAPAPMADYYATVYDPIETLTYAAAKTRKIKLGTSIIDALFHAPVILGRRYATLDHFSGGRVIAGLGQGAIEQEFRTANVPTKRKGAGFGEFIAALRAVWGPDPVHFEGRFYEIAESEIGPKPVQAGGPPIIVASNTPPSLERSAQIADGINPFFFNRDQFQQMLIGYRGMVKAAGRDPKQQIIVVRANSRVTLEPIMEQRPPLSGSIDQIADDLRFLQSLEVDHAFFDMNGAPTSIDDQLRYMEQLQKVVQA